VFGICVWTVRTCNGRYRLLYVNVVEPNLHDGIYNLTIRWQSVATYIPVVHHPSIGHVPIFHCIPPQLNRITTHAIARGDNERSESARTMCGGGVWKKFESIA